LQLKECFSGDASLEQVSEYDSFSVFTPLLAPPSMLPESADKQGLGPIFRMARSPFVDAQVEAARTLADLTAEESIQPALCEEGTVELLRDLLSSSCSEWAQHHAAVALANLSDCRQCQRAIIDSGVLPVLLSLAVDGPYQSAEIRRLAVFVLANVSSLMAEQVLKSLGHVAGHAHSAPALVSWMSGVDGIVDDRVKFHAVRAKQNLIAAF
jgi:hypothetical protein